MAEPIDLPFGLWTRVGRRKHKFKRIRQVEPTCPHGGTLAQSGKYDWIVRLQRRCGLMSNYFDHLLSLKTAIPVYLDHVGLKENKVKYWGGIFNGYTHR